MMLSSKKILYLISNRSLNITEVLKRIKLQDINLNKPSNLIFYVSQNKNKDIYIKTKEQIHEIPYDKNYNLNIPLSLKPVVSSISGIYQVPPIFYNTNDMIILMSKMIHKFIYCMFSGSIIKNKKEFFLRLETFFQIDNETKDKYYYPIAQHIITSVLARFESSADILEYLTDHLVDYSSYKNSPIHMISLIEAIVLKNTQLDFIKKFKDKVNVVAQNPDNEFGDHKEFAHLSYKQGKQPHMDFRINQYNIETFQNKIFFYDIKLSADPVKTLSLSRGHLSLSTHINKDFLMSRAKGDFGGSLAQKNPLEKQYLNHFLKDFETHQKNKKLSSDEKFLYFEKFTEKILLDPKITVIIPSIIKTPPMNQIYNNYLLENFNDILIIKNQIQEELIQDNSLIKLIPEKGQQANVDFWHKILLNVIKKMPPEVRENMLENFHKFKLIEYDYDI